jgi:hypothetical protein
VAAHLISQDVVPIGAGYLILMGVLAAGLRLQRRDPAAEKVAGRVARRVRPGWPRFAVQIVSTALGGYLLLEAVVILYYYGVAHVAGQFLESAFTGAALMLAISLPLFAARSWLAVRRVRRRAGRPSAASPSAASGGDQPSGSSG